MAPKSEVLLLTGDIETENDVISAFESGNDLVPVGVCRDFPSLVNHLAREPIPIVLVDIDPQPNQMLHDLEAIANKFVHTRFVVLCTDRPSELVLKAMQVGARHIQVKSAIRSELADVLRRLIPTASAEEGQLGIAITVLSASGGCGSTTLVVNLANELQLATSESVLLIDLDYSYGAVSTYLELRGEYGIADVLAHNGRIDAQLINTTAVPHSENLHVLASPASVHFSGTKPLREENLDAALQACRQGYAFTLIDAPRMSIEAATTLAQASELTMIVLQPMVKDIRVAKAMLSALIERGISSDRIRPIMNRYRKRHQMITFEDAQKALGGIPLGRVSNDYQSAIRGINYGRPLAQAAPRSALRRDLLQLAVEVSELNSSSNGKDTV